ncbi:MAG: hypothetical protein GOV15_04210 [Candidatus Diapherotrites archaeon]|nr:hypothetical protein [Candidatus Diapherotrites archaeon]
MNDALDKLIIDDSDDANIELLAKTLEGRVSLTRSGVIQLDASFHDIDKWKKIAVYLLARKAVIIKGLGGESVEGCTARVIADNAFVTPKDIDNALARQLKGLVSRTDGGYFIPTYNLLRVSRLISGKEPLRAKKAAKKRKKKTSLAEEQLKGGAANE